MELLEAELKIQGKLNWPSGILVLYGMLFKEHQGLPKTSDLQNGG